MEHRFFMIVMIDYDFISFDLKNHNNLRSILLSGTFTFAAT